MAANSAPIGNQGVTILADQSGGESAPLAAPNRITGQFTSTGTATKIVSAQATGVGCTISNTDSTAFIYIGASGVTIGTGTPIAPGQSVTTTNRVDTYVIDDSTHHALGGTISEYN